MKKTWIVILSILIIGLLGLGVYYFFFKSPNDTNNGQYHATRTSLNSENSDISEENKEPTEIELHSFSTPIKSNSKNRLQNIKITCSRINGTTVKSKKEFSFCDVVGQPSSKDGYKPADAFGADGKIIQAIGGGNCQVSTTIYNAVLKVDGLKVTERHEHDRDVSYIQDGKDATVAYDYLDLKFKNNNDFDIKLYAFVSDNKVTVKVFKLS